jgi:hypothetical protein
MKSRLWLPLVGALVTLQAAEARGKKHHSSAATTRPPKTLIRKFDTPSAHFAHSGGTKTLVDAEVELRAGTPLLDAEGRPLEENGTPIAAAGGIYAIQKHPVLPIGNDVLIYVWGGTGGTFDVGATGGQRFSGFVKRSEIVRVSHGNVPTRPDGANRLTASEASSLERQYSGHPVKVQAHQTHGTYSSAHHALSDYGYASSRLSDFLYGALNLPGYAPDGGQTAVILKNGDTVTATRLVLKVHANEANLDPHDNTFVFCIAKVGREKIGAWIVAANLPGVVVH